MLYTYMLAQAKLRQKGAGLAEYALLLALIAVVVIASLGPLANAIAAAFNFITAALNAATN